MSDQAPPPAKPPKPAPPNTIAELREQVKLLVGQKIHGALTEENPSAAQLHAAMKWLDQTANSASASAKSPFELALESARQSMAGADKLPDLSPDDDEEAGASNDHPF